MEGIELWRKESLMILVRNLIPAGPKCLRWRAVSLSGPKALELLRLEIAVETWVSVKEIGLPFRAPICLMVFRVLRLEEWGSTWVNSLFSLLAMVLGKCSCLPLKLMELWTGGDD